MQITAVQRENAAETVNARELDPVKVAIRGAVTVKSVDVVVLALNMYAYGLPTREEAPAGAQLIYPDSPTGMLPVTLVMISTEPEKVEDTVVEPETEVNPPLIETIPVKPLAAELKAA